MTEPEDPVAEARRLLAKRTPGEWEAEPDKAVWQVWVNDGTFPLIADVTFAADAALIAAAPRLLAVLCERLKEAERERGALRVVTSACFRCSRRMEAAE